MATVAGIAFLLLYVLGAFAYGAALVLSIRQASPVWSSPSHDPQSVTGRRLTPASVALFGWSAVWFVIMAFEQFADLTTQPRRGPLDLAQLVLIFGFPPLIMHTMFLEAGVETWTGDRRVWATRVLRAGYAVAVALVGVTIGILTDLLDVPRASAVIGISIAALFTAATIYAVVVMRFNPRPPATITQRKLRRTINGLFVFLCAANLGLLVASSDQAAFGFLNRVMSLTPLLFLSATTYYENPFEFYDLLVKRGALLGAGMLVLGAFFASVLPWLDTLPRGPSRPWLFAVTVVPLVLAAPWLAGQLGRALDRAWFGRHHTPVSAVTTVLAAMQSATDEADLVAAAERSLADVLGVTVQLTTTPPDAADARVAFEVEGSVADPSVWVVVPRIHGERALLSEDLRLLRSLGTVVTYLIENVRLQQRRQEQDLVAQELRVQSSQSELKALRAQINPHFLFNALNTVASLIHSDPARADRSVEQLSEVFRHTLRRSESEWAALDQELSFAQAYLDVEEARFGARLQYSIEASPEARRAHLPAMLLHTLIENAVKHGIAQVRGHGRLDVEARVVGGALHVTVTDNGPGPQADGIPSRPRRHGEQFGLRSVRDRLRGHFGDEARFELRRDGERGVTVAHMVMPLVTLDAHPPAAREVTA